MLILISSSEPLRCMIADRELERNTSDRRTGKTVAERGTSRSCSKIMLGASKGEASMSRGTQTSFGSAQELNREYGIRAQVKKEPKMSLKGGDRCV